MRFYYNDDLDTIQSLRFFHSLVEAGLELSVDSDQIQKLAFLNQYFTVPYNVREDSDVKLPNLCISHKELPACKVFDSTFSLVYPKEIFYFLKGRRPKYRKNVIFFQGLLTEKRQSEIEELKSKSKTKIKCYSNDSGRVFPRKCWDYDYYKKMIINKFVFCPDGDFIWTYRFFEAIMCGCIPIIQNSCSMYEGFQFYTEDDLDKLEYDNEMVKSNDILFLKKYTINKYEKD